MRCVREAEQRERLEREEARRVARRGEVPLYSIDVLLLASKNRGWRQRTYQTARVMIDFLQSNGLTKKILVPEGERPPDDFELLASDLTEAGREVALVAIHDWLEAVDRAGTPEDVTLLEQALARVRKGSNGGG